MAVYQLENEHIYLEVASHGAELVRLVGKKTKKEYLFDGDPKYWKRHSPILFPFVGGVKNKEYRYNGKTYTTAWICERYGIYTGQSDTGYAVVFNCI